MPEMKYEVRVSATAEIRDADGNLISSTPVESTTILTEDELLARITHTDGES